MDESEQPDIFGGPSDLGLLQLLLADLHDELPARLARYRYLTDISGALGEAGTLVFGGTVPSAALGEARSSFVHGNFVATVLLCQALAENTLAGLLHTTFDQLPKKITFNETLTRCEARGFLSAEDVADLRRLAELRNPLSHFREVSDPENVHRRSIAAQQTADELLERDGHFAIATTASFRQCPSLPPGTSPVGEVARSRNMNDAEPAVLTR